MKQYDVDPEKLAEVFKNTTATYKFYWMLALLDHIKRGRADKDITFNDMVAVMISKSWNSVNSGLFTFGACDELINRIHSLIMTTQLNVNDVEERVFSYLVEHRNDDTIKDIVSKMTKYVPYRFLSPWIGSKMNNTQSALASQDFEKYRCPYAIIKHSIRINPAWMEYLADHLTIFENHAKQSLQTFLLTYNKNIIFADNEAITADGSSTSLATQYGFASEPPMQYGKNNTEKDKQIRQLEKELKQKSKIIDFMMAVTQQTNIINYGPSIQLSNQEHVDTDMNFYSGSQNVESINNQSNKHYHGRG